MLNRLRFFTYILLVSALFTGCSDGDPGPQGEPGENGEPGQNGTIKLGYAEGTVSGKKQDGTAFSETFRYQYSFDSVQAYYEENGSKNIRIERYLNGSGEEYLYLGLKQTANGAFVPSRDYAAEFTFSKDAGNDLFSVFAVPHFEITESFVRALSLQQNIAYEFSANSEGEIYYYLSSFNGEDAYSLDSYLNGDYYAPYYSVATGSLLAVYDGSLGTYEESGVIFNLFNKLKFKYDATLGTEVFYDRVTNAGLYEAVPSVPADQLIITNYAHDATTGVVTFDYELKISGTITEDRENSTGHDLTIKGKFNSGGKVYKNTVGRIRS